MRATRSGPREITRRQFLTRSAGAVVLAGAGLQGVNAFGPASRPRQQAPVALAEEKVVPTLCPLCPSNCGLSVRVVNGQAVKIEGNPLHPVNQGTCCPQGQAALEVLYSPERIRQPMQRTRADGAWEPISWESALDLVASRLRDLRARELAHTTAIVYGETRGQMRALVQRFLAAFGSPNAIEYSDGDQQAARLATYLMQGVAGVPVCDWESTRYVLAFGGSLLEAGRDLMPALSGAGFMRRGTPNRGKLVVVDARLSVSAAKADEWVPIRPGTLGALALGLANVIISSHRYDERFVRDFAFGFEDFADDQGVTHRGFKRLVLEEYTLTRVEAITGVSASTMARLAGEFAASRPAVALLPTGRAALASGNALSTAMAIYALNALIGSLDTPGGVLVQRYPSLTPFPPLVLDAAAQKGAAMGRIDGAGTGAFPLAASVPPGMLNRKPYPLEALFLLGANPVFDLPAGEQFAAALDAVPLVVSFSSVWDESAAHADLVLPAATSFEAWGDAYLEGTGYAGLTLAQPVVQNVSDSRHPGDVLLALARKIGGPVAEALPFADYMALLKYRLTGSEIGWDNLVKQGAWSQMIYRHSEPGSPAWNTQVVGCDRVNAPRDGRFDFFSRELFSATRAADRECLPHFDLPAGGDDASAFPYLLILAETMTQPRGWNGVVPTLQEIYGLQSGMRWDSWVELNARAAAVLGVQNGDRVWVESAHGKVQARARLSQGIWRNAVAMPLGQGHRTRMAWGREAQNERLIGVNPALLAAGTVEPWSGLAVTNPIRVRVYKES